VFDCPDTLATLLTAIDREVEPRQSTRVARALSRVVVRDLDQRVSGALMLADQDMYNATTERDGRVTSVPSSQLVVLADALAELRPDGRSRCLAGCARIVARRFEAARSMLATELRRGHRGLLRGWLTLNLGAAQERLGRLADAHAAYHECGAQLEHPSSATAALFALCVSLRMKCFARAERDLTLLLARDPGALHEALRGLQIHYAARYERSGCDPLAWVRPSLVQLGGAATFIERELRFPGACSRSQLEHLAVGAGAVPTRTQPMADRRRL
jgi:hypothetical protein